MVARCCRRSRGGHGEGAGQGGEDRGASERRVDGEAVPTASGGGGRRRGGGLWWSPAGVMKSCSLGELREWGICMKFQGLVARGGAHRAGADDEGAQPESARERGLPVARGGGPGVGSGGEARALERRGRRGVGTGGRVDARAGSELLGGSAAEGKEEGKRWGCHAARGCRGAWPRPAVIARQRPEHGARGRRAPRARVPA
jgi:hypothetical protein